MKRCVGVIVVLMFCASQAIPQKSHGYVPDEATAVKIAEAALIPVYGKEHIESERPFHAKLSSGVWTVGGTLYCAGPNGQRGTGTQCAGGVAVVKISEADGRILSMTHYK